MVFCFGDKASFGSTARVVYCVKAQDPSRGGSVLKLPREVLFLTVGVFFCCIPKTSPSTFLKSMTGLSFFFLSWRRSCCSVFVWDLFFFVAAQRREKANSSGCFCSFKARESSRRAVCSCRVWWNTLWVVRCIYWLTTLVVYVAGATYFFNLPFCCLCLRAPCVSVHVIQSK